MSPYALARNTRQAATVGGLVVVTMGRRQRRGATVEEWLEKVAMVSLGRGDECHRSMLMGWRPVAGECGGGAAASPENHRKSFPAEAGRRRRRNLRERRRKDLGLCKKTEVFGRFYIASPPAVTADPPPTARHHSDSGPKGGVVATAAEWGHGGGEWREKVTMVSVGRGDECHGSMLMGWRPVGGECGKDAAASPKKLPEKFFDGGWPEAAPKFEREEEEEF
nr:hypothetical protein [Tanacetum cinerariifolium]